MSAPRVQQMQADSGSSTVAGKQTKEHSNPVAVKSWVHQQTAVWFVGVALETLSQVDGDSPTAPKLSLQKNTEKACLHGG